MIAKLRHLHAERAAAFGIDARCERCGRTPYALEQYAGRIVCRECSLAERERATFEIHHVFGRKRSPIVVAVPANAHALVNAFNRGRAMPDTFGPCCRESVALYLEARFATMPECCDASVRDLRVLLTAQLEDHL